MTAAIEEEQSSAMAMIGMVHLDTLAIYLPGTLPEPTLDQVRIHLEGAICDLYSMICTARVVQKSSEIHQVPKYAMEISQGYETREWAEEFMRYDFFMREQPYLHEYLNNNMSCHLGHLRDEELAIKSSEWAYEAVAFLYRCLKYQLKE
jgi:hypothetical protein